MARRHVIYNNSFLDFSPEGKQSANKISQDSYNII